MSTTPSVPEWMRKYGVQEGEWFIACKDGLAVFMRPGWPLKLRVSILLILHSHGYRNELAMTAVQKDVESDTASRIVALSPGAIASKLQKIAIEECRKSKLELDDEQRKRQRPLGVRIREVLEELEQEDGTITRVRANCEPKKLFGLTFDEAMAKNLITPIMNLSQRDRKKLNQRSFVYVHLHPRPATKTALTRRVDDDVLNPPSKDDQIVKMLEGPKQLAFRYLRAFGLPDAKFAAKLAEEDEYQSAYAEIAEGRIAMQHGMERVKKLTERRAKEEIHRRQMDLFEDSQPSAVLNPNGQGESGTLSSPCTQVTPQAARAAETHNPTTEGRQASTSPPERDRASSPAPQPQTVAEQLAAMIRDGQAHRKEVPHPEPITSATEAPVQRVDAPAPIPDEIEIVLRAGQQYVPVDDDWAARLLKACRAETSDVTGTEVAHFVDAKWHQLKNRRDVQNMAGLLMVGVPKMCKGAAFQAYRRQIREYEEQQARARQIDAERTREFAQATIADQGATDEEREWARKILEVA